MIIIVLLGHMAVLARYDLLLQME